MIEIQRLSTFPGTEHNTPNRYIHCGLEHLKRSKKQQENFDKMTVNSFCEEGHSYYKNIRDYYKLFSDERNVIREDICSICHREN